MRPSEWLVYVGMDNHQDPAELRADFERFTGLSVSHWPEGDMTKVAIGLACHFVANHSSPWHRIFYNDPAGQFISAIEVLNDAGF